jgi:hypothetical protein
VTGGGDGVDVSERMLSLVKHVRTPASIVGTPRTRAAGDTPTHPRTEGPGASRLSSVRT